MSLAQVEHDFSLEPYRRKGHLPSAWRANGDKCYYTRCAGCGAAAYVVSRQNRHGIWVLTRHGLLHEEEDSCPSPLDKASCVFPSEPVSPEMKKLVDSPWKPT